MSLPRTPHFMKFCTPTNSLIIRKKSANLMANNWDIPDWLEKKVRERDKTCVYCDVESTPAKVSMKSAASWEHIINDAKIRFQIEAE